MALATSFNECNRVRFKGNQRIQCLAPIDEVGFCEPCASLNSVKKDKDMALLLNNIEAHNLPMIKYCLNVLPLSNYQILKSCYSINALTPKKIIDLIYFNDKYEQRLYIMGIFFHNRISPQTLKFVYEKIFLITCLLDSYDDKGLLDLKHLLISTKISQNHLDLLHD